MRFYLQLFCLLLPNGDFCLISSSILILPVKRNPCKMLPNYIFHYFVIFYYGSFAEYQNLTCSCVGPWELNLNVPAARVACYATCTISTKPRFMHRSKEIVVFFQFLVFDVLALNSLKYFPCLPYKDFPNQSVVENYQQEKE